MRATLFLVNLGWLTSSSGPMTFLMHLTWTSIVSISISWFTSPHCPMAVFVWLTLDNLAFWFTSPHCPMTVFVWLTLDCFADWFTSPYCPMAVFAWLTLDCLVLLSDIIVWVVLLQFHMGFGWCCVWYGVIRMLDRCLHSIWWLVGISCMIAIT